MGQEWQGERRALNWNTTLAAWILHMLRYWQCWFSNCTRSSFTWGFTLKKSREVEKKVPLRSFLSCRLFLASDSLRHVTHYVHTICSLLLSAFYLALETQCKLKVEATLQLWDLLPNRQHDSSSAKEHPWLNGFCWSLVLSSTRSSDDKNRAAEMWFAVHCSGLQCIRVTANFGKTWGELLVFNVVFNGVYVGVHACMWSHLCVRHTWEGVGFPGAGGVVVVSHLIWVLGTTLGSSG